MAKNFDYILLVAERVPGFKRLHDYCDMAETLQATYPEASANSSRKALEWLVKNMLRMKDVQIAERETLGEMIRRQETTAFINGDIRLENDMRKVHRIGNCASHDGGEPVKRARAFRCLYALYNVVAGFMYRWGAMRSIAL